MHQEDVLHVTVKALGDYTSRLIDIVEPGTLAVIGGPHGRFNHTRGTDRQIWIAGGVGVAPFVSWLRAIDEQLPQAVDFFYSTTGKRPSARRSEPSRTPTRLSAAHAGGWDRPWNFTAGSQPHHANGQDSRRILRSTTNPHARDGAP